MKPCDWDSKDRPSDSLGVVSPNALFQSGLLIVWVIVRYKAAIL
ncbi:MAG: hypothetical protein UV78_C0061G0001, partial [Parcubacteria group bacterium GW2011_GWA2_43_17]